MIKPNILELHSIQLAKQKIKFYQPFERLFLRKIVQTILNSTSTARIDLFAIFDAVHKRGGFNKVQELKRWIEIQYSLPYYKINFKQIYLEHIFKKQSQIKKYLKLFDKQYTITDQPFVQLHFVSTSSAGGYYHFEEDQNSFCKQNFTHIDLYLNIKSLCTIPSPTHKILYQYSDKYLLTRKWLIMKGYSKPFNDEELDKLQILKIYNNNASIALIGWNLANLLLASKLHQLKLNVVLYTNLDKQHDNKYLQRLLSVQQGVFYLDDGIGGPFSYKQLLSDNDVQMDEVSNYCGLIDQNGRTIPQFRVRQSQELFLGILADFKFQQSNKKTLSNEVLNLLSKKKLKDELNLMKWHLQRYFMLNNLNGQETTVSMHSTYLSRRKHKIYMSKKRPMFIKNTLKLIQKSMKSFTIVQSRPKSIDFCNNMWLIQQRMNQRRSFSSLVYSDAEQIYEMISKRNYRLQMMQNENFLTLKDLSANTWINCFFRFTQKLKLKPDILSQLMRRKKDFNKTCYYDISQENCSFQFSGTFGFYYYFVVQDGTALMARCKVQKFLASSSTQSQLKTTLSTQMLKQFEQNFLNSKLPSFMQPQVIEYSHFFYLRQDGMNRDRVIKLKNWQRMYLSVGLTWALNANKLTSQIDCSNQILALIANVYYHMYKYDEKARQQFNKQFMKKKLQINKKQQDPKSIGYNNSENKNMKQNKQQMYQSKKSSKHHQSQKQQVYQKQQIIIIKGLQRQKQIIPQPIPPVQQPQYLSTISIDIDVKIIPNQMQIFKNQILSQNQNIIKDSFGFNHHFIKSTYKYLNQLISKFKIQIQNILNPKNQQLSTNLSLLSIRQVQQKLRLTLIQFQHTFQIHKPFKLYKNMYLHSLGQIYIKFPSTKNIIKKIQQIQRQLAIQSQSGQIQCQKTIHYQIDIKLFEKYIVKRQYFSLENPFLTSIYIHCVLFIQKLNSENEVPLYVIFDQTNLAIFYYHTSLTDLTDAFNDYIQKQKKKLSNKKYSLHKGNHTLSLQKDSTKIQIMLEQIKYKIQEQLKFQDKGDFMSETQVFNKILSDKLKSQVSQQAYDNPSSITMYSKITYPQSNQQKTHFLLNLLNDLARSQLQRYGLKLNITFMDIFFGYLSPKYFIFEIYWTRQLQHFSKGTQIQDLLFQDFIKQLQDQDTKLFQQIKQIMDQNIEYFFEDYPISLQFDETGLLVQRKFLASKNDSLIIRSQSIQDTLIIQKQTTDKKNNKKNAQCYFVQKSQLLKNYSFIKEYNFKEAFERKNDKQKVRCFLIANENDRLQLDPKQDPLQLIISILVDTWDYEEIYTRFKKLVRDEIMRCEYSLSQKMKLYYKSTRKRYSTFGVEQINQLRNTLSYKKKVPQGKMKNKIYRTEYCNDQDDRQTIFEHIENQNMVFADGQIIICKY